jgi:hypothetical protein
MIVNLYLDTLLPDDQGMSKWQYVIVVPQFEAGNEASQGKKHINAEFPR